MIRWCQNLLLLNYSYAFERSFDCKVTSRFLPSVVSYPARTFRTQIVETSRIQRIKSFRTHLSCFVPSSVVSSCKTLIKQLVQVRLFPYLHNIFNLFYYYHYYRNYYYHYYYFNLFHHNLCWCSFCESAGRKPCTQGISTQVNYSVHTLSTFLRICADPSMHIFWMSVTVAAADTFFMFTMITSSLYQAHQQPQGSLRFSKNTFFVFLVLGLCTCFSFPFSSERCFYQMEQSYQSVCRWNSPSLQLRFLVRSLLEFSQYWLACPIWWWCCCLSIVHHSLWLKLVPFVCNLDIMIFTMGDMLQHYCALRCTLF